MERSVESVAVRQGGHWACGCSHICLILSNFLLLHIITQYVVKSQVKNQSFLIF